MIVILAVALIVVGPDKLPELARSLAKGVNELKNTMNQVKESLSEETKIVSSVQQDLQQAAGQVKTRLLEEGIKNPNQWKREGEAETVPDSAKDDAVIAAEAAAPRSREENKDDAALEQSGTVEADVRNGAQEKEPEDKTSASRPSSAV